MWDYSLLAATRSIETFMAFVLYRFLVYGGTGFAYLLAALAGAGTFIGFASFSAKPSAFGDFGAAFGIAGLAFLLYRFRGSLFFNVKAGQLALLTAAARGDQVPGGKAQIDHAKQVAAQRFTPASFAAAKQSAGEVLSALPAQRLPPLARIAHPQAHRWATALAGGIARSGAEPLLSLNFIRSGGNTGSSLEWGLAFQYRHFSRFFYFRVFTLLFEYAGMAAFLAVMFYPVNWAASALPVDVGAWRWAFAAIFAWSLKATFLTPIATAAQTEIYTQLNASEPPPSQAETAVLSELSETFRSLRDRAG